MRSVRAETARLAREDARVTRCSNKRQRVSPEPNHAMTKGGIVRFLVAAALAAGVLYAQRGPAPYYEDANNVPVSPEVRMDRTVTFRLFAPKASEVVLMGSPGILEFTKSPMP